MPFVTSIGLQYRCNVKLTALNYLQQWNEAHSSPLQMVAVLTNAEYL